MQVASLYPDHQKAPDAQYKLGVVYHKLGDTETAKQYLERVQETYPRHIRGEFGPEICGGAAIVGQRPE